MGCRVNHWNSFTRSPPESKRRAFEKSNLRGLWLTDSPVADLSPLAGLPLESLTLHRTLVNDLSFVRKLPVIQRLHIGETLIEDLSPLEGLRITRLVFTPSRIKRGMEVAQRLQGLREIGVALTKRQRIDARSILGAVRKISFSGE